MSVNTAEKPGQKKNIEKTARNKDNLFVKQKNKSCNGHKPPPPT